MSYDWTASADEQFSRFVPFAQASRKVASIADVRPNGACGFVLERGKSLWMEIDLELVSEEDDRAGAVGSRTPAHINCIRFHVPYAYQRGLDACLEVAVRIAGELGWDLYDEQTGEVVVPPPPRRPWWRLW